jgi:uncharacterized DUF497 family protein
MKDVRIDWDRGNWPKCGKHGLIKQQIEESFENDPMIMPDPYKNEERWRAIGRLKSSRLIFVVFTLSEIDDKLYIRPISARYMHDKEIRHYEER